MTKGRSTFQSEKKFKPKVAVLGVYKGTAVICHNDYGIAWIGWLIRNNCQLNKAYKVIRLKVEKSYIQGSEKYLLSSGN